MRRRTHNHVPSFGSGLQGIDDQIDERLGQLIGVGFNFWQRVTKLHDQIDAPFFRLWSQQLTGMADQFVHGEGHQTQRRRAGEL